MQLNYLQSSNDLRLKQILHTLETVHGIKVNFDLNSPNVGTSLLEAQKTYEDVRDKLIKESAFNSYLQNAEYTKSILILEAVKIMLKEIAPKRRRKHSLAEVKAEVNKNLAMPKPSSFADQLSDIAAKIPGNSEQANAFSNALSTIAEKMRFSTKLDDNEQYILSWIRALPKPVSVSNLIRDGIEKFGSMLLDIRKDDIRKFKKIDKKLDAEPEPPLGETNMINPNSTHMRSIRETGKKDQDGDGKHNFKDVMIARMMASGMPKHVAIAKVKNKKYNSESEELDEISKDLAGRYMRGVATEPKNQGKQSRSTGMQRASQKIHGHAVDGKKVAVAATGKLSETAFDGTMSSEPMAAMNAATPNASSQAQHYEYQASMARSELYRNAKYAMSMMKQIDPHGEVQPWIAGALTKAANYLDKIYHYLDYYKKFEPEKIPEQMDGDMELGETSGGVTRQNLMMIMEYSIKLFEMVKPGEKLEGWVAMKLTTASECISSCKHYLDYVQFEQHGLDDHFQEARKAKIKESKMNSMVLSEQEDLAKASTILAAKDMSSKVQSVAEDIAKMSVEDLMPLVDIMRGQFGPEAATAFNSVVKETLDALLDQATKSKETMDEAIDTLNRGGVPAQGSDIESAGDMDTEAPDDEESDKEGTADKEADLAADIGKLTGGEPEVPSPEPLGRAKKPLAEARWGYDKKSASMKLDQEDPDQRHGLYRNGKLIRAVNNREEAENLKTRDAKYKDCDIKKIMESTIGRQQHKSRIVEAKKKNKFTCEVCGKKLSGDAKNTTCAQCNKTHKKKAKKMHESQSISEKAPPGAAAERFITKNKAAFEKRYGEKGLERLYATAWKKFGPKNESYITALKNISTLKENLIKLQGKFHMHKKDFAKQLQENKVSDPLNVGYGLIGTNLLHQINNTKKQIKKLKEHANMVRIKASLDIMHEVYAVKNARKLQEVKRSTPYGVLYTANTGKPSKKLFETQAARKYWLEYQGKNITNIRLIDPKTFDHAISRTLKRQ